MEMGKSTISTGPFSSSQTVSLPEGMTYDEIHWEILYLNYMDQKPSFFVAHLL